MPITAGLTACSMTGVLGAYAALMYGSTNNNIFFKYSGWSLDINSCQYITLVIRVFYVIKIALQIFFFTISLFFISPVMMYNTQAALKILLVFF